MSEIRVLHVIGRLDVGGVETWLKNVLPHLDPRIKWDFVLLSAEPGKYDSIFKSHGCSLFQCVGHHRPLRFQRRLRAIMREKGPYHVVHSHVHHYSGVVLLAAYLEGIYIRIAHSHVSLGERQITRPIRQLYFRIARRLIRRYATIKLAAGEDAGEVLFGAGRYSVVRYGVDLHSLHKVSDPNGTRRELGLDPSLPVLGHVGRFEPQKNHRFLIDLFKTVTNVDGRIQLLLVGDGILRPSMERLVSEYGLEHRVVFAGVRSDVPRLIRDAMDLFVFPSLFEGVPIAVLEAQAAGVPIITSLATPCETILLPDLCTMLSLEDSIERWKNEVLRKLHAPRVLKPTNAAEKIEFSHFGLAQSARALSAVYVSATRQRELMDPIGRQLANITEELIPPGPH